ncbi:MAG: endonuclease/exonuclease/phosphatase family protein [Deltaproteobacteria bacterium]|nr:endonuclease/exonuclease/phosphatase family protein [Deltaproteobacteria bacterium]
MQEAPSSLSHDLHPHILLKLREFHSTESLEKSPLFQEVRPKIQKLLSSYDLVHQVPEPAPEPFYRCVAWNIERGMRFEAILHYLKNHPLLSTADILLITEADLGMARSGNRDVAQELAQELQMNYFFAPSYLNLSKGCGIEQEVSGENKLGIAGNAILSRYPISNPMAVPLPNAHDKMRGREKRVGSQSAPIAQINLGRRSIVVSAVHLDVRSTQKHRILQLEKVTEVVREMGGGPALIGGDWNTSTYDAHSAFSSILGFWIRVFIGTGNMIKNHYPHPDRFFERRLFERLEANGFDYKSCNELGVGTSHFSVGDLKQFKNLREWLPNWCFRFVDWALKEHGGRCSFKLDWFTQRGLKILKEGEGSSARKGKSVGAKVIGNLDYENYPSSQGLKNRLG